MRCMVYFPDRDTVMLRIFVALLCVIVSVARASAQGAEDGVDSTPLETELELEEQTQDLNPESHEDGEYTSKPVGKQQRWQLDSGEFNLDSTAPKPRRNSGDGDGYSGFRLRLPTKPK